MTCTRSSHRLLAAGAIALALTFGTVPLHTDAAGSVPSLLAQAIKNTNTVKTLVHHDTITIVSPTYSMSDTSRGLENETQNREQDYESVTVKTHPKTGTAKSLHYTIDIIFMNGQTYYRASQLQNKWKTAKGMTFKDPYTGGWERGRTTVGFKGISLTYTQVGQSSGQTQFHTTYSKTQNGITLKLDADLWVSSGNTPYVVRQRTVQTESKGTQKITQTIDMNLGPFNQPANIQPPTIGA